MERTEAAPRYFYDEAYFDGILGFERSWLLLASAPEGDGGAGAIAAVSDGVLHYYLGGTAESALESSPFKNVVVAMMELADELGMPLNLGGGLSPGDGLERFKRGFANAEAPFVTHEIVCDPPAYERLQPGRDAGGFFPVYRAPLIGIEPHLRHGLGRDQSVRPLKACHRVVLAVLRPAIRDLVPSEMRSSRDVVEGAALLIEPNAAQAGAGR